ncbi:MAG: hypothetical protein ACTSP3_07295 [Candidatus Heimdallarchaeaceae archaeon]
METSVEKQFDSDELIVRLGKLEETIKELREKRNKHNELTKEAKSANKSAFGKS